MHGYLNLISSEATNIGAAPYFRALSYIIYINSTQTYDRYQTHIVNQKREKGCDIQVTANFNKKSVLISK